MVDGHAVGRLNYREEDGLLGQIELAGSRSLSFGYDQLSRTGNFIGFETERGVQETSWAIGDFGDIIEETLGSPRRNERRAYSYDSQHFLVSATSSSSREEYGYGEYGLPSGMGRALNDRFDASGRLSQIDGATMSYDGFGQLSAIEGVGRSIAYHYDEEGRRVLKTVQGKPRVGFDGDVMVDEDGLHIPILAHGIRIGTLVRSGFVPELFDPRQTKLPAGSDVDDASIVDRDWAGPFGEIRTASKSGGQGVFAGAWRDPDTGLVRLGTRDYDPRLAAFTTPDAAFLGDIEACLEDPVQCNLYSYARNNPLRVTDPEGDIIPLIVGHLARGALVGAGYGLASAAASQYIQHGRLDGRELLIAAGRGAVHGLTDSLTLGLGRGARIAANAAASGAVGTADRAVHGQETRTRDIVLDLASGAFSGALAGKGTTGPMASMARGTAERMTIRRLLARTGASVNGSDVTSRAGLVWGIGGEGHRLTHVLRNHTPGGEGAKAGKSIFREGSNFFTLAD